MCTAARVCLPIPHPDSRSLRPPIPAYVVASYTNPVHTHGTFAAYRRLSSKDKWLRVHDTNEWLDFYTHQDDLRRFFDHYLKGIDNGWEKTPKVRLSVLNPGGQAVVDRVENEWPLARTQYTRLYLNGANQTLQYNKVKKSGRQTYDPNDTSVELMTIGGDADQVPDKAEVVASPAAHNKGRHSIYTGGSYDSYLYVPVIPAKR